MRRRETLHVENLPSSSHLCTGTSNIQMYSSTKTHNQPLCEIGPTDRVLKVGSRYAASLHF